jgi:hypothetical protein
LAHLAIDYGISVSTCWRIIRWVEDQLIRHPSFHLPGKKVLKKSEIQYEIVVVDASESPIQRPKKKSDRVNLSGIEDSLKGNFIQVKEKHTPTKVR